MRPSVRPCRLVTACRVIKVEASTDISVAWNKRILMHSSCAVRASRGAKTGTRDRRVGLVNETSQLPEVTSLWVRAESDRPPHQSLSRPRKQDLAARTRQQSSLEPARHQRYLPGHARVRECPQQESDRAHLRCLQVTKNRGASLRVGTSVEDQAADMVKMTSRMQMSIVVNRQLHHLQ